MAGGVMSRERWPATAFCVNFFAPPTRRRPEDLEATGLWDRELGIGNFLHESLRKQPLRRCTKPRTSRPRSADAGTAATDTKTATITGSQTSITVNPAPAKTFAVTGFPSPTTAGVSGSFTVTAKDP